MKEEALGHFKEKLYDCLVSESGADALCTCIAEEVGNPVSIHLPSRTIVAHSADFTKDLLDDFVNAFALDEELDNESVFGNIVDQLKKRSALTGAFPYYRHKQILMGCFSEQHLVAILDCVIVNRCDINESIKKIEFASSAVVPVLKQKGYLNKNGMHHMQIYLNSLLRGERQKIYQQLGAANSAVNNTPYWQLIVLSPSRGTALLETLAACERICSHREKIWSTLFDNHVVILADASLSDRISEIADLCSEDVSVVISDIYSDLDKTSAAYTECLDVREISKIDNAEKDPVYVQEYKSVLFFLSSALAKDKKAWENAPLMRIRRYDQQNDTEYYPTLRAYLTNNMNFNQMADVLHVHKNTIVYRLQRISELFNLDLKDCGIIADLYFTLFLVESTNQFLRST